MSDSPQFLDMAGVSLDTADVAILSVPWEGTVSFGTGTAAGPAAIAVLQVIAGDF